MNLQTAIKTCKSEIDQLIKEFFSEKSQQETQGLAELLLLHQELEKYLLGMGKRLRPFLFQQAYSAMDGRANSAVPQLVLSLEFFHNFLLIQDDIIDRDIVRHNQPTFDYRYTQHYSPSFPERAERIGIGFAVLGSDLLYAYSQELLHNAALSRDNKYEVLTIMNRALVTVTKGQTLDLSLTLSQEVAVPEKIIQQVFEWKTALYSFCLPIEMAMALTKPSTASQETWRSLGLNLGIAYQIQDDILGLFGETDILGKRIGSDLSEAKRTLLIREAWLRSSEEERDRLESVLGNEQLKESDLQAIKELIIRTGALKHSEDLKSYYHHKALNDLKKLNLSKESREIFEKLVEHLMQRIY